MEELEKLILGKRVIADKISRIVAGELVEESLDDLEIQWEIIETQIEELPFNQ